MNDKSETTTEATTGGVPVEREVRPLHLGDYFTHIRTGTRFVVTGITHRRDGFRVKGTVEIEFAPEDEA